MDARRRILVFGLVAVGLIALFGNAAAQSSTPSTDITALCEEAKNTLPNDPSIQAFLACAVPGSTSSDCCQKLVPFAKYQPCLDDPSYVQQINDFMAGKDTVDQIKKDCLS